MKDLIDILETETDRGDLWGENMEAWFAVAAELCYRGENVPADWEYRAGMSDDPREHDSFWFDILVEADSEHLLLFGNYLNARSECLKAAGLDY